MSAIGYGGDPRLVRELITPEGVDLRLQLADAGERVSAFFIDVLIILGTLIAMTVLMLVLGLAFRLRGAQYLGAIWILGFFLLRNFYFMAFELTPRAATPGKRILGLRVATRDGGPLTANAIFARNAMRELEVFLPLTFMLSAGEPAGRAGSASSARSGARCSCCSRCSTATVCGWAIWSPAPGWWWRPSGN